MTSVNFNLAAPLSVDRPGQSEKRKKSHIDQESPNIHVKTCVPFIAAVKAHFHKRDQLISKETYKLLVLRSPPDVDENDEEFQTVGCKKNGGKRYDFFENQGGSCGFRGYQSGSYYTIALPCALEASAQIKESKVTRAADFEILLENIFIRSRMHCSPLHLRINNLR